MSPSEPDQVENLFHMIYQQFIYPVRERLKDYDRKIISEMRDQDFSAATSKEYADNAYDTTLRRFLGGIGSGAADGTVIQALWQTMENLLEKFSGDARKNDLRSVVLQTFSNAYAGRPGRQMWAAREIAAGASRVRSLLHAVWYLRSSREYDADDNPDVPVGLYNLLMNPQFFDVFRSQSAIWYPQPLLVTTETCGQTSSILPELGLEKFIEQLGGVNCLEEYRSALRKISTKSGLNDEATWSDVTEEHVQVYRKSIDQFVAKIVSAVEVESLRTGLESILCDEREGAWSKLPRDAREEAKAQLRRISARSLVSTFLFLLLHEPNWTHYYYFVFGSVPNTSGPSLAIFTSAPLRRYLQVCAQYLLTEGGKHLAILETQKLAAGRAEERMSYFNNLQTHTFTKGFTTPVHNETMRLDSVVPKAYDQGAAGRAQDRLRRFEYAMQSSEFLGVGEVREDEPDTYRYTAEWIDSRLCQRLVNNLHDAAQNGVKLRLNDLFDDPEFAEYSGIDPAGDFGSLEAGISCPNPNYRPVSFFADYPLLAYHLQSIVQNATEAIDLVAAWQAAHDSGARPQSIHVEFGIQDHENRPCAVFSVTNTSSDRFPVEVEEAVNRWQEAIRTRRASPLDWSPRSGKSGGHSGMGLLLAATFCQAICVDGADGTTRAQGQLLIASNPYQKTVVSLRFPLKKDDSEEVWIDRRILLKVPTDPPLTVPTAVTGAVPPVSGLDSPPLGLKSEFAKAITVIIVEDDTADRQRFRLHLRQRFPTAIGFHTNVAFAWHAAKCCVPSPKAIFDFLFNKGTGTKVFLDLAWDRNDENDFFELRTARNFKQYADKLDNWANEKRGPKGLILLRLLADAPKLPRVQVIVVTAYKSQHLMRYLEEKYAQRENDIGSGLVVERPFMKWSDGERLKDFIGHEVN